MPNLPLIVAQYQLHGHRNGPQYKHWSLVMLWSRDEAYIFDVQGATGTFVYDPRAVKRFNSSRSLRGGYFVGEFPAESLGWLIEKLKEVPIPYYDETWDCQSWVMDALCRLKDVGGIITKNIGRAHIKQELQRDEERFEYGEDTVEERLFPVRIYGATVVIVPDKIANQ